MYICNMLDYILYLQHVTKRALPELHYVANNSHRMAIFGHKKILLQPVLLHLVAQRSSGNP